MAAFNSPAHAFVRRAAVCFIIGMATTILAAWLLALAVRPYDASYRSGGQTVWSLPSGIGDGWSYWTVGKFGTLVVSRLRAHFEVRGELKEAYLGVRQRQVPAWSGVHRPPPGDVAGPRLLFLEDARGWPMLSLRSETQVALQPARPNMATVRGGILLASDPAFDYQRTILPLQPIWIGFIIDTAFFAAIAFVGLFGVGAVRRKRRRRRGVCERCGYDLRAAVGAACPECGAAVARGEDTAG